MAASHENHHGANDCAINRLSLPRSTLHPLCDRTRQRCLWNCIGDQYLSVLVLAHDNYLFALVPSQDPQSPQMSWQGVFSALGLIPQDLTANKCFGVLLMVGFPVANDFRWYDWRVRASGSDDRHDFEQPNYYDSHGPGGSM